MSETIKGVLAIVVACTTWGLVPLYYKEIAHIPPLEVLGHRTVWSFVTFGLVLAFQRRLGLLFAALLHPRTLVLVGISGLLISTNWFVFILSIQIGRAVEASLGYYLFPLVAVALGYFVFSERLKFWQWLSVALAATAVLVLTVGLGVVPFISLVLAATFGLYGLLKKSLPIGSVVSVTGEVLLLLPFALFWLFGVHFADWTGVSGRVGGFFGSNIHDTAMLVFSGFLTAGPLILFAYAARRLTLATVGLMQYINPTLQFLVAVLLFQEAFTPWHALAFGLIWAALAIFSSSMIIQEKSARKAATNS